MWLIYSILAHLHPPWDNPKRVSNNTKNLIGNETSGTDPSDGLRGDDMEQLRILKNTNLILFEKMENTTLTQVYISKNQDTDLNKESDNNEENPKGGSESQIRFAIIQHKTNFVNEYEKQIPVCKKTIDIGFHQGQNPLFKKIHIIIGDDKKFFNKLCLCRSCMNSFASVKVF